MNESILTTTKGPLSLYKFLSITAVQVNGQSVYAVTEEKLTQTGAREACARDYNGVLATICNQQDLDAYRSVRD